MQLLSNGPSNYDINHDHYLQRDLTRIGATPGELAVSIVTPSQACRDTSAGRSTQPDCGTRGALPGGSLAREPCSHGNTSIE